MDRLQTTINSDNIFPLGKSVAEGHNLIYLAPSIWEREVFEFLDQHVSSAKGMRRS